MYVVLGATGHVGSAVAETLLAAGEPVTIVTRSEDKAAAWRSRGAEAAMVDVGDADALRAVLRRGRRAFLLNPPAPPATDKDAEERRTAASIVAALDGSGLDHVVAQSTFGARADARCGDLTVLWAFEQALQAQAVPATILRAAYYMSNWDAFLDSARGGSLPTMLPPDRALPMVAPADLGAAAARLLREPPARPGIHPVEGPARYAPDDVAAAFAQALGRPVEAAAIPRERWEATFREQGFSDAAAESYARMTAATADGDFPPPDAAEHGPTTLDAYIAMLVARG